MWTCEDVCGRVWSFLGVSRGHWPRERRKRKRRKKRKRKRKKRRRGRLAKTNAMKNTQKNG